MKPSELSIDTINTDPVASLADNLVNHFSARRVEYSAKDVIYHAGDKPDTVYFLSHGMVKLSSHLASGHTRIVRLHTKGSWLGLGLVLDEPCQHTAVALSDVVMYQVRVSAMRQLKAEAPASYCQLQEYWFEYLQRADRWIVEFSTGPLKARLARLLNYLAELEGHGEDDKVTLLTCEEMAGVLGSTAESVSRLLAEFKRTEVLRAEDEEAQSYEIDQHNLDQIAKE